MIHTVKNPFFCRKDQFKAAGFPGQVLVIGIDLYALQTHNPYAFRIGKSPTIYSGDSVSALQIAYLWINKRGRKVAIIPVGFFTKKEVPACQKEECLIAA